jgi:hypothetical protein
MADAPRSRFALRLTLSPSTRAEKKWMVACAGGPGARRGWAVHFGARGYEDYTTHRDAARKARYVLRHRAREQWGMAGVRTPGFWSRWLLWNRPSLRASLADMRRRFPALRVSLRL